MVDAPIVGKPRAMAQASHSPARTPKKGEPLGW